MTEAPQPTPTVTLDNCEREPIHIPGSIQPIGALLAFDQEGTLLAWSENTAALLGLSPGLGKHIADLNLDELTGQMLRDCQRQMHEGDVPPMAMPLALGDRNFDLIVHGCDGRVIAEFEQRAANAELNTAFALKANRAIESMKRGRSIDELLSQAVQHVRSLSGFDRVMAYRFRHDDSGDIVAEAKRDDLEAFFGRRYPASDIPAQARRLYTINTLRLIGDVNYSPVPLAGWRDDALNMSHCVLRSVSPIHIEYLKNMGVSASMSVSIVVDGRLWGMIACHHMSARQVPFDIRMACDVLAQVIAANVQALEGRARALRIENAARARTLLTESLLVEDDVLHAIEKHADALRESLQGEALIASQFGKIVRLGDVDADLATQLIVSLQHEQSALVERTQRDEWSEDLKPHLGPWVGLLALLFDPSTQGILAVLKREQVETIRWGGKPEKEFKIGPLGPRLTPRGSFAEWREVVRDKAEPWDETSLSIARQLYGEMQRSCNARHAETERARTQLLAMLGHDLRDPLQSITMAATVIGKGVQQEKLSERIKASSNRMQRLISIVLDVSRIESGRKLGLNMGAVDLGRILRDLVEEARTGHPGVEYVVEAPPSLPISGDADRLGQVISNLISNARHHGKPGRPISIRAFMRDQCAVIEVSNDGDPIDPVIEAHLFSAFKAGIRRNSRNPTGMGLGLHITHAIVSGHGGTLTYRYEAPNVIFSVSLPQGAPPAS